MTLAIDPRWLHLPRVLILGRPNVGKSSLFNQIVKTRDAIVADQPGVTIDLHSHLLSSEGRGLVLIDSGGVDGDDSNALARGRERQVREAIRAANALVLVMDGRTGVLPFDEALMQEAFAEGSGKPVWLIVNKVDPGSQLDTSEFYQFGLEPTFVSAEHRIGVDSLRERLLQEFGCPVDEDLLEEKVIRFAFIGRPNVGKSTWCNRIFGQDVSVVTPIPGTTRDVLRYRFFHDGTTYEMWDTAGLRQPGRRDAFEGLMSLKTLRALEAVDVAVLLVDATSGIGTYDAKIASEAWHRGAGLVVAANKWDMMEKETTLRAWKDRELRKLSTFGDVVSVFSTSGKTGSGHRDVMREIKEIALRRRAEIKTHDLNERLREWVETFPHRRTPSGRIVGINFLTQTARAPHRFLLMSNRPKEVDPRYVRYLEKRVRETYSLGANPVYFAVIEKPR